MSKHLPIFQFNISPSFKNLEVYTISYSNTKTGSLECLIKWFRVNSTLIDQSFFSFTIPLLLLIFLEIFMGFFFLFMSISLLWKNFLKSHQSPNNDTLEAMDFSFTEKISSRSCPLFFLLQSYPPPLLSRGDSFFLSLFSP
jgi:hypothetical protein